MNVWVVLVDVPDIVLDVRPIVRIHVLHIVPVIAKEDVKALAKTAARVLVTGRCIYKYDGTEYKK